MAPEFWTVPWAVSPAVAGGRFLDSPRGGREPKRPVSAQGPPMAIDCLADAGPAVACPPVFSEHEGASRHGSVSPIELFISIARPAFPALYFPQAIGYSPPIQKSFQDLWGREVSAAAGRRESGPSSRETHDNFHRSSAGNPARIGHRAFAHVP